MHSGFNGLSSGVSVIILISLIIKSVIRESFSSILGIIALTGATFGFYLFERYPSKIFWGNVGSLTVGSAIGVLIVMQGFIVSDFIMLLPHTINFLIDVCLLANKEISAGQVREDQGG